MDICLNTFCFLKLFVLLKFDSSLFITAILNISKRKLICLPASVILVAKFRSSNS